MSAASLCTSEPMRPSKPEIYELLEAEGIRYAIRLSTNQVLQRRMPFRPRVERGA